MQNNRRILRQFCVDATRVDKYSLEKQVTVKTPSAFLVHAFNDPAVNVRNSLMFYNALLDKKVSASLHIFPTGEHSIALRINPSSTEEWTKLAKCG